MQRNLATAFIVFAVAATVGCARPLSDPEKGAIIGGAVGAGSGALIGEAAADSPGTGALIGGGVGALGGALIGEQIEDERRDDYYDRHRHDRGHHDHRYDYR